MGQRHQIFVYIPNPVKHIAPVIYPKDSADVILKKQNETKKLIKEFGDKDYSILAYHNQWLYGRSALLNAINLLKFGKQFDIQTKTSDKGYKGYDCPFTPNGMKRFDTPEKITTAIEFIMNYKPTNTEHSGDAGFGGSFYIGGNEWDEGINFDFTRGDNNDGITIIDLIHNKYCFMNISEQNKKGTNVYRLTQYFPCSAKEYVKAYYGESLDTINPYYIKDKSKEEIKKILEYNRKANLKCYKPFEKFDVLSIDEVKDMFSTMELFNKKPKGQKITLFEKK